MPGWPVLNCRLSAEDFLQLMNQIGEEGRATYLSLQRQMDWIIPGLIMGMLVTALIDLAENVLMAILMIMALGIVRWNQRRSPMRFQERRHHGVR
jgi:mannose/fructose/N-acetylgalactosamine-specific phosphotransferase system component IID